MKNNRYGYPEDKVLVTLNNSKIYRANLNGSIEKIKRRKFRKIKYELVELLIISKFGSLTAYYDILLKNIIDEYNSNKEIDNGKLKLCVEIMDEVL